MQYFLDAVAELPPEQGNVVFLAPDGDERISWTRLVADATRMAGGLQEAGVGPGTPVVVLGLTSRATVTAIVAVWLAGGSLTVAPLPARGVDMTAYLAETRRRLTRIGRPLVLVGPPFEESLPALGDARHPALLVDEVLGEKRGEYRLPALSDEDPAVLQVTSGTTGHPKIVRISHANLGANIHAIRTAGRHAENHGRMLSWLPLSHDMGLVGTVALHLACGRCDLLLMSPADYLSRPASWMRLAASHRATALVAPASAYALAGRLLRTTTTPIDLSSVTMALCGGEPISPDTVDEFLRSARPHGFRPEAFLPAYGLAEATLAVTFPPPHRGMLVEEVDAETLETRGEARNAVGGARSRRLPRLGPPAPGVSVRVVDQDIGKSLPEGRVGEVQVTGTSVTAGYQDSSDEDSLTFTADGWLRTGDLGYLVDGELVICGRSKDVIIIGGRNIYPEEVELAACQAPGVRRGNVICFRVETSGSFGSDGFAVAAESREPDVETVRADVTTRIRRTLGLDPQSVVILPPGSIPKTPSGKLRRSEAARMFAS